MNKRKKLTNASKNAMPQRRPLQNTIRKKSKKSLRLPSQNMCGKVLIQCLCVCVCVCARAHARTSLSLSLSRSLARARARSLSLSLSLSLSFKTCLRRGCATSV